MSAAFRIGIDLGGTKIEGAAVDLSGAVRVRRRVATPRQDYGATIAAIISLIGGIEQEIGTAASIGVGIPGAVSPITGLVKNANSTWLIGRPLKQDLEAALGRPTRLANDANCFALSEATDGAGAGMETVFGVILGTGVGGGVAIGGRTLVGANAIAGEWGHNPLPWADGDEHPGPVCWCGRAGCLETWVSGPGLEADHARATGVRIGAEEIAARAHTADVHAQATLARHARRLARGLAHVINIFDPDVIVLGGGLSKLTHLYDVLPHLTAPHVFAAPAQVVIKPPAWGDAGGVRGAAWLWD